MGCEGVAFAMSAAALWERCDLSSSSMKVVAVTHSLKGPKEVLL